MRRHVASLAALALLVTAAPAAAVIPEVERMALRGPSAVLDPAVELLAACDDLDPARCLLPFPNDRFTAPDPTTPTGLRIDLDPLATPRNIAGKPVDTTEWNRNDGFSPGSMLLTYVPGLDLQQTFNFAGDLIEDPARSLAHDAPIVLVNAHTGERHPYWAELDTHPDTTDADRLLIIRPTVNFDHGARYVVGLRELRDGDGALVPAGGAFSDLRSAVGRTRSCAGGPPDDRGGPPDDRGGPPDDRGGPPDDRGGPPDDRGKPDTPGRGAGSNPGRGGQGGPPPCENLPGEQGRYQRIFETLEQAGVDRDQLYLAWDFTVASAENLTGRALAIRDDAFTALGDPALDDLRIDGDSPQFTVSSVTHEGNGDRTVRGKITVPNYLAIPQWLQTPELPNPTGQVSSTIPSLMVPLSRLYYGELTPGPMAVPQVNPLAPTMEADWTCRIPAEVAAGTRPGYPTLYGHGLLGSRNEATGSSTARMREDGFVPCAVDWLGMSTSDLPAVAIILSDVSHFPLLPDRAQQGFLNFMYLGRALLHDEGLTSDPAFQTDDGRPVLDTRELFYDGNSQGGIKGGALTALAPDFTRAVLGVPAMNYSTLLNRSVDWEGAYGDIFYVFYPDKADQQILMALLQMLWDRAESNGYAHHMTDDPLPNTPPHQVLLHVAFGDHQVANIASEVQGRTIGARFLQTALAEGRHWAVDPTFDFAVFDLDGDGRPLPHAGSALVYFDSGNPTPLNGNVPPLLTGGDPHSDPRRDVLGQVQKRRFYLDGLVTDPFGGQPYWTQNCRGAANPNC